MSSFGNLEQYFDAAGNPLINGFLYFFESGSNNTEKTTFADSDQKIENTHPVELKADGRQPAIFFTGSARVILTTLNGLGEQLDFQDPVGGDTGFTYGSPWLDFRTYAEGDVARFDNVYYQSLSNGNIDNQPDISPTFWRVRGADEIGPLVSRPAAGSFSVLRGGTISRVMASGTGSYVFSVDPSLYQVGDLIELEKGLENSDFTISLTVGNILFPDETTDTTATVENGTAGVFRLIKEVAGDDLRVVAA